MSAGSAISNAVSTLTGHSKSATRDTRTDEERRANTNSSLLAGSTLMNKSAEVSQSATSSVKATTAASSASTGLRSYFTFTGR